MLAIFIKRYFRVIGLVFFLILFLFSFWFFKERTLFMDPCYQLFEMINKENFVVFVERYSMVLNQWLPLLFIKLEFSLKSILKAYSFSFILVYFVSYLITEYVYKAREASIAILFGFSLANLAFFHSISENLLALSYGCVFYAWYKDYINGKPTKKYQQVANFFIGILIILICYYIHAVSFFTTFFSIIYLSVLHQKLNSKKFLTISLISVVIYFYKTFFGAKGHDAEMFEILKDSSKWLYHLENSKTQEYFFSNFSVLYLPLACFLFYFIFLLIRLKKYFLLFVYLFLLAGFMVVTSITFALGESEMGMQSRYIVLSLFVITPVFSVFNDSAYKYAPTKLDKLLPFIVIGFCFWGLIRIADTGLHAYRKQLHKLNTLLTNNKENKMVISENNFSTNHFFWSVGPSSILFSSIDGKEKCKSLYVYKDLNQLENWIFHDENTFLLLPWWIYHDCRTELNKKYFDLCSGPYYDVKKNYK